MMRHMEGEEFFKNVIMRDIGGGKIKNRTKKRRWICEPFAAFRNDILGYASPAG